MGWWADRRRVERVKNEKEGTTALSKNGSVSSAGFQSRHDALSWTVTSTARGSWKRSPRNRMSKEKDADTDSVVSSLCRYNKDEFSVIPHGRDGLDPCD